LAELFFAELLRAVLFFAELFLAELLRAVLFFAELLRAVLFLAELFFAELLRAVLFFAELFRAVDARAVLFFALLLRAAAFLRGAAFFFEDEERFFAELRAVLRFELREPERDEERVVAGMAGAASLISELDASPMAESPNVMLDEPAADGSSVAPVPLQSSWVINRPPGSDCDVHDSLPRCFVTFNADSMNHAHVAGKENVCIPMHVHLSRTRYADSRRRQWSTTILRERVRQARALSSGVDVGASTPPARSTVTFTVAPVGTRSVNVVRSLVNVPAR
jgi:hypothetical protein